MLRFAAGNVVIEWDIESTQSDCEPANGMLYKLKELFDIWSVLVIWRDTLTGEKFEDFWMF